MSYDANVLVEQLRALGRDLDHEVVQLGKFEEECVDFEWDYRRLDNEWNDRMDEAFIVASGSVEQRKAEARIKAVPARLLKEDAYREWQHAKARVRTQQASLNALHRRVEIGRSLLSREKTLMDLERST
jgi:hypothetical protein